MTAAPNLPRWGRPAALQRRNLRGRPRSEARDAGEPKSARCLSARAERRPRPGVVTESVRKIRGAAVPGKCPAAGRSGEELAEPDENRSGQDLQQQSLGLTSGRAVVAAPSAAGLPGSRCTVTPASAAALWRDPHPPPTAVPLATTAQGGGYPVLGHRGGTESFKGEPARLCGCRCRRGTARLWAVSRHTPVGRDEGSALTGEAAEEGELAEGGCRASANLRGRCPQPALPSAGRGAGVAPVSPARVARSEGLNSVWSPRLLPGPRTMLSLMRGSGGEGDGASRAVTPIGRDRNGTAGASQVYQHGSVL